MNKNTLFLASLAGCTSIWASTMASVNTSAGVGTSVGTPCNMSSSGSPITCMTTSIVGGASGGAYASASAAFGNPIPVGPGPDISASAFASADEIPPGYASAEATSSYDQFVEILGSGPPGTLTGTYLFSATVGGGEISGFAAYGALNIVQGSTSASEGGGGGSITISSPFQFGVPFEMSASLIAQAITPGPEIANISVQLLGFTDQSGNPLQYQLVSEPATSVMGALGGLFVVLTLRKH